MQNNIRRAEPNDIDSILVLLEQVLLIHHNIRPDLFKERGNKYTREQLETIVKNDCSPVFVYETNNQVIAHAFCIIKTIEESSSRLERKILFIDDLVVHEAYRNQGIGSELYDFAKEYAKSIGCDSVLLDVWEGNDNAIAFYRKKGLKPQQIIMEEIIKD